MSPVVYQSKFLKVPKLTSAFSTLWDLQKFEIVFSCHLCLLWQSISTWKYMCIIVPFLWFSTCFYGLLTCCYMYKVNKFRLPRSYSLRLLILNFYTVYKGGIQCPPPPFTICSEWTRRPCKRPCLENFPVARDIRTPKYKATPLAMTLAVYPFRPTAHKYYLLCCSIRQYYGYNYTIWWQAGGVGKRPLWKNVTGTLKWLAKHPRWPMGGVPLSPISNTNRAPTLTNRGIARFKNPLPISKSSGRNRNSEALFLTVVHEKVSLTCSLGKELQTNSLL